MNLLVKTALVLTGVGMTGCATRSQQSETLGADKNQVKTYNCEFKVLYKKTEDKQRVQNNVRPYKFDGQWLFLINPNNTNNTKVPTQLCKELASDLHREFRIEDGNSENGEPRFAKPEVMAVYWQSYDTAFGDDSHGIACTNKVANSEEKNDVYKAFKYSCGHEFIREAK